MAYTIICHHHLSKHAGRHPQQWEDWQDAAQEICDIVEGLAKRVKPSLNSRETLYALAVASQATRSGVAILPGLVTYQVIDVADAPSNHEPGLGDVLDWAAVGRLARQAQKQTIELNHLAALAAWCRSRP
jgi:hypothetical protein